MVAETNGTFETPSGPLPRLEMKVFNLEDEAQRGEFVRGATREVPVPGSSRRVSYDPLERTGVGLSRLGSRRGTSSGAVRGPCARRGAG